MPFDPDDPNSPAPADVIGNKIRHFLADPANEADLDAYPVVLELIGTALEFGLNADSMGGRELTIVRMLQNAVDSVILNNDPDSYIGA